MSSLTLLSPLSVLLQPPLTYELAITTADYWCICIKFNQADPRSPVWKIFFQKKWNNSSIYPILMSRFFTTSSVFLYVQCHATVVMATASNYSVALYRSSNNSPKRLLVRSHETRDKGKDDVISFNKAWFSSTHNYGSPIYYRPFQPLPINKMVNIIYE